MRVRLLVYTAAAWLVLATSPASASGPQPSPPAGAPVPTPAPPSVGAAGPQHAAPSAAYLQALRVADLFLSAWATRDVDAGASLMSSALMATTVECRSGLKLDLKEYMSGTSNPHHEGFEIAPGRPIGPDRFLFPVRLFEIYAGEPSGVVYSDTLGVVRQESGWKVDRLPRDCDPD